MAALAAAGDFRAAEAAREMAWEQLHSGPWHSVLPVWRDAYSMACLRVAKYHYSSGEFKEALRVLDMGLIMGGMLLRKKDLDSAVDEVSWKVKDDRVSEESYEGFGKSEHRLVDRELNQAEVVGKKYIRLYSASLSEELYPYAETMLSNSSQVDLDDIDERKFPEVQESEFVDCILEEGEMLYIPRK